MEEASGGVAAFTEPVTGKKLIGSQKRTEHGLSA
jgi:hypothetical protein